MQEHTTAFVVGGYVSSEKKWKEFDKQWTRALEEAGIDIFHATDFFSRRGACNRKGDRYEDWSDAKHLRFARRFTAIAARHTILGVGRGVDVAAYRAIVMPEPLFRAGTPHQRFGPMLFCAQTCLEKVAKAMQPFLPKSEQMAVIFEDGPGVGETIEWGLFLRKSTSWGPAYISFTPLPKSVVRLQAADLMAHEAWRYITEQVTPTGRVIRKSLQRLVEGGRVSINIAGRDELIAGVDMIKRFAQLEEHEAASAGSIISSGSS